MPTLVRRSVSAGARSCPGRSSQDLAALRGLHLDRPCAPAVIWQLEEAGHSKINSIQSIHTSRGTPPDTWTPDAIATGCASPVDAGHVRSRAAACVRPVSPGRRRGIAVGKRARPVLAGRVQLLRGPRPRRGAQQAAAAPVHHRDHPPAGLRSQLTSPKPTPATRKDKPQGRSNPAHPARQPGSKAQPQAENQPPTAAQTDQDHEN
jgi:hypothetical protein